MTDKPRMFAGFKGGQADTSTQRRSRKFPPGRFVCRIDQVTAENGMKNGEFLMFRMTVLGTVETPNFDEIPMIHHHGKTLPVGSQADHKIWERSLSFGTQVVSFCTALLGVNDGDVDENFLEQITGSEQPLKGVLCEFECEHRYRKDDRNADGSLKDSNEGGYLAGFFWRAITDPAEARRLIGDQVADAYDIPAVGSEG